MKISICQIEKCTGCGACFNACPSDCISMISDQEGFLRPVTNVECCNDCGVCQSVCPALHPWRSQNISEPQALACWNNDRRIRYQSSSGGVFSALAEYVIENGGIVFGAAFDDNMRVRHIAVDEVKGLWRLRGSKYVQSDIGRSYSDAQNVLRRNKLVLFSGTPCQVAGLYSFLGSNPENLVTCDLLCYGVPSPEVFAKYVRNIEKYFGEKIIDLRFRDKRQGWELSSTVALFGDGSEKVLSGRHDSFLYGFQKDLFLRPVCYHCVYKSLNRPGDLTLGDFWDIGKYKPFSHSTKEGVSLVLVNSKKGYRFFQKNSEKLFQEEREIQEVLESRSEVNQPRSEPKSRTEFFVDFRQLEYGDLTEKYLIERGAKGFVRRVVPRTWIFHIKKLKKRWKFRKRL